MQDNENIEEKENIELLKQIISLQKKQIMWLKIITASMFILFVASIYF